VVVVESKRPVKTGNYLEMVGSYDARVDKVSLNTERILHWIGMGATVSDTVHNILVSQKVIDAKKINVLPRKTVAKVEEPAAPAEAPPAPTEAPSETPEAPAEEPAKEEAPVITDIAEEKPTE